MKDSSTRVVPICKSRKKAKNYSEAILCHRLNFLACITGQMGAKRGCQAEGMHEEKNKTRNDWVVVSLFMVETMMLGR